MPAAEPRRLPRMSLLVGCALLFVTSAAAFAQPVRPRIVNGTPTSGEMTTGALLSPANPALASTLCSGTLIGCQTFLTAAHCVCDTVGADCQGAFAPDPSDYVVFLQHFGFVNVASVAVHPDFDFPVADVAVLTLAAPIAGVSPTPINLTGSPAAGAAGRLVGFGRTGGGSFDYGIKRAGAVEISPCVDGVSDETSVCWNFSDPVGPEGTDSNTCNGDSGGPLFVDFGCGDTVAGITSGGTSASCLPADDSYDANVYTYRDYIAAQAGADLNAPSCGAVHATGITGWSGTLSSGTPQASSGFAVTAGTTTLRVVMNGVDDGLSDFDLYVKHGAPPTTTDFDCKADGPNQFGACEFASPVADGDWFVLMNRFSGSGIFQVTITEFAAGAPPPGSDGQSCDDQNSCTESETCLAGVCGGVPVVNGTPCDDGSRCTTPDECQAGACVSTATLLTACKLPVEPAKASVQLRDRVPDRRDRLSWKWVKGELTTLGDLGDPTTTSNYELCVYDESAGTPALIFDARVPAGPKWYAFTRGFRYKDSKALTSGMQSLILKHGEAGRASIVVKGKADFLPMPALPLQQDPTVTVQLSNESTCWEATYGTSLTNTVEEFKAKAD
jgi:hypothetical protein